MTQAAYIQRRIAILEQEIRRLLAENARLAAKEG